MSRNNGDSSHLGNSITIIPAQLGWLVLTPCQNDAGQIDMFHEMIVIAWKITNYQLSNPNDDGCLEVATLAYPITGEGDPPDNYILQDPQGRLFAPCLRGYVSREEALEHLRKNK